MGDVLKVRWHSNLLFANLVLILIGLLATPFLVVIFGR